MDFWYFVTRVQKTMKFILGTKLNMTQVFAEDGRVVPVTRVQAGPCVVTQLVHTKKHSAIEIGYGTKKSLNKPEAGHRRGLSPVRFLRRFTVEAIPENAVRGKEITVETFAPGELVTVTGISKGKGFQGVVKRHHFHGQAASHGHKDQLRMPGSIGATTPQRVFKDMRMAGHMGTDRVTVKNLEIVAVDAEKNELLIKGAIPGATGSLVTIKAEGELKVKEEQKAEAVPEVVEALEAVEDLKEEQPTA